MSWPPKMGAVASILAERVYKTTPAPTPRVHRAHTVSDTPPHNSQQWLHSIDMLLSTMYLTKVKLTMKSTMTSRFDKDNRATECSGDQQDRTMDQAERNDEVDSQCVIKALLVQPLGAIWDTLFGASR